MLQRFITITGWLIFIALGTYFIVLLAKAYYHMPSTMNMPLMSKKLHDVTLVLSGRIISFPHTSQQYDKHIQQVTFKFATEHASFGTRTLYMIARQPTLSLSSDASHNTKSSERLPQLGETWECPVTLRRPGGFRNPGVAYFASSMAARGLYGIGLVNDLQECRLQQQASGVKLWRRLLRQPILALPSQPGRALLLALLLGDRSELTVPLQETMAAAGLSHLLAVSGLHISIMAGLGFWLGRQIWSARQYLHRMPWRKYQLLSQTPSRQNSHDQLRWSIITALLLALSYAVTTGLSLATLRAASTLLFALIYRWHFGVMSWRLAFFVSLCVTLLLLPWSPMVLEFWCSFGAVALLLITFGHQHQKMSNWQMFIKAQLLLTLGLLPAVGLMTGALSIWSPIINAVAIPLLGLVLLPGALLGLVFSHLGFMQLLTAMAWLITFALEHLTSLLQSPLAGMIAIRLTGWQALGLLSCVIVMAVAALRPLRWYMMILASLSLLPWQRPVTGFWLDVLDVGQGNSILVRTRQHTLLYDAGARWQSGRDAAQVAVIPFLRTQGIHRLNRLIISHEDNDHRGGAVSILKAQQVDQLFTSFFPAEISQTMPGAMPFIRCHTHQAWWWDGVLFRMTATSSFDDANNRSCVLWVSDGTRAALLPGDIEYKAEQQMLELKMLPKADVVVVPHHGSKTSSSTGFINKVQPQVAVMTASDPSRFGHPANEVLARYLIRSIQIHHTGQTGALHWRSQP